MAQEGADAHGSTSLNGQRRDGKRVTAGDHEPIIDRSACRESQQNAHCSDDIFCAVQDVLPACKVDGVQLRGGCRPPSNSADFENEFPCVSDRIKAFFSIGRELMEQ